MLCKIWGFHGGDAILYIMLVFLNLPKGILNLNTFWFILNWKCLTQVFMYTDFKHISFRHNWINTKYNHKQSKFGENIL
jgi:hypothetical protein